MNEHASEIIKLANEKAKEIRSRLIGEQSELRDFIHTAVSYKSEQIKKINSTFLADFAISRSSERVDKIETELKEINEILNSFCSEIMELSL
jgi:hypothetical protein